MAKFVLVAEDDRAVLDLVTDVLKDAGYEVGGAMGADTVKKVRAQRPDLLLLDYQMPGMNGVQVAEALRADPETAGVPIITMTAAGNAPLVCQQMRADACLGKPFEIDHLVDVVDRLFHSTH
jgi:CheY-like chemotaxis protein